ncbi:dihydropteroate synthase [soil metagenome]
MLTSEAKDTVFNIKKTLNLKGNIIDLSTPVVMQILNITPDSFYPDSRVTTEAEILKKVERALNQGATMLDVGGYSTRPGAAEITEAEELNRIINVIRLIEKNFPEAYVSIDTFRARVAYEAISAGACMINDISGGQLDENMFDTVAKLKVPYILMHMRGTPETMKSLNIYKNLLLDLMGFFHKSINKLINLGVKDIVVDPGFGFAKSIDQNYEILKNLKYFAILNAPVLIGISRKSMIYKRLNIPVSEALNGTTVLNVMGLMNGASILRVHDTGEAMEAIKMFKNTFH